jgi:hypothetical protein
MSKTDGPEELLCFLRSTTKKQQPKSICCSSSTFALVGHVRTCCTGKVEQFAIAQQHTAVRTYDGNNVHDVSRIQMRAYSVRPSKNVMYETESPSKYAPHFFFLLIHPVPALFKIT